MNFRKIFEDLIDGFLISWKANKKYALYNIFLNVALALLPLISLWYIKKIIDIVTRYENADREDFIYAVVSLVIVQLLQAGIQQVLNDIQVVQQQLVIDHLSQKVIKKAISVEYTYYENSAYYDTLHLAQQEVIYKASLLTNGFNQILLSSLSMLMLTAVFLQFNWMYGVLVLAASIPVLAVKWKHAKASQELEKQNLQNERKAHYLNRILTDAVHAKEVRTYYFGEFFLQKYSALRERIFWTKKRISANQSWAETIIQAIEIIILAVIVINLGFKTLDGVLTAGSFIFYFQALQRIQSAFTGFVNSFTILFRQRFFLHNIFGFLNLPVVKNTAEYSVLFPSPIAKGIIIDNVSFSYSDAQVDALSSLSMQFEPGKITAIIGENGSGKSTLAKLLTRLYAPTSGSIKIDEHDINTIDPELYADKTAIIFQDYNQYHFSLTDNIVLSREKEEDKMASTEDAAGLHNLIDSLPYKRETVLGKMFGKDQQLSGGQWQKIAIARMLYKNAEIMILDEPTSNIDPMAEYEILKKITARKKDKIVILITHRLHNLKFADNIYLMENGKVQGEGTIDDLLSTNNLFKEMYQRQQLEKGVFNFSS
jgi:ATP-binding cassette, subfamily B, bacterial